MIFITARIIRSNGQAKFADAELPAPSLTTASSAPLPNLGVAPLPGVASDSKAVVNP